ncbi:MAG: hypothetical protein HS115_20375 [Spirochaetales bacterium]|nr:hypothetical protein [Spirochaetales bacterium]
MKQIFLYALLVSVLFCDSRAGEKNKEQELNLILLFLQEEKGSPCIQAETSGLSCAMAAGRTEALYVASVQTAWKIQVPAHTAGQSPAAICQVLGNSPNWSAGGATHADSGKACQLGCQKEYYDQAISEGRCQAATYETLQTQLATCGPFVWKTSCNVEQMKNCLNACFVQGTLL